MNALERCHEVVTGRHAYAQQWKERTGGKVVGYFCTYVPEERLLAAGILPVRVLARDDRTAVVAPLLPEVELVGAEVVVVGADNVFPGAPLAPRPHQAPEAGPSQPGPGGDSAG